MLRFLFRLWSGARLPITHGEMSLDELRADATIRRDAWGVAHIEAQSDEDASFALGFAQAQDRAGQLEIYLRIVRGTLAEIAGKAAVPVDLLSRRIGFYRAAERQVEALDADVRQSLSRFALGVNAGAKQGAHQWPHEFALMRSTPTEWQAADVLAYIKFLSFQLPSNWDVELARLLMLRSDGAEAALALDPTPAVEQLKRDLRLLEPFVSSGGGSNNWVVSGSRSASGKPLMGSDPHLGPTLPNPWYMAHASTPEWGVAGAMFAGTPVFPIGHNGFACWSVTAGLTDTTDLFLETIDGRRVQEPDGSWKECTVLQETIGVKGEDEIKIEILETARGPIVTPLIPEKIPGISLRAIWLEPRRLRGFVDAPRARSFEQFRASFEYWPVLPLNVLYADETGAVGSQLIGELPRRTSTGLVPTPVQHAAWQSLIPFESMPHSTTPDDDVLVTANDDPWQRPEFGQWQGERVNLGADFVDPYRAQIIREELLLRSDWTPALFQQLQLNLRSKPWEEIRETLLALLPRTSDAMLALDLLREWDGYVTADSPAAAVFELFLAEMATRTAKSKAKNGWVIALGGSGHGAFANSLLADRRTTHLVQLIRTQPPGWFASWPDEMLTGLEAAVTRLREAAGPSPPFWAWGHRRLLRLKHPLFGRHWLLGRVFNLGPVPIGGDMNTVAQAGVRPMTPFADTHNFPNLRAVMDTSDWENCRFALAGGQSGNPCSPHFGDQFPLWQRGEGIPIPWKPAAVLKACRQSLRLTPTRVDAANAGC